MVIFKAILNILSAISALVAAFLWFKATLVNIPPSETPDNNGWISSSITSEGADVIATARSQNLWNRYAALTSAVAALAQGISLLIPTA